MTSLQSTILVVDDEPAIRLSIAAKLTQRGHTVLQASGVRDGRAHLAQAIDLALLNYQLPDGSGFDLLNELRSNHAGVPAIMLTAHATIEHAVAAIKHGAFHYVSKPLDLDELSALVEKALETTRSRRRRPMAISTSGFASENGLECSSPQMAAIGKRVSRIAVSPGSTVLIAGESGTGKDLVARAIHKESNRAAWPFSNITCSALPSALLESELFGHERGAFTDAKQRKIGLLEHAHGGTVFLDEIGELELSLQAKLLRFLEDKTFRRVGGNVDIQTDVRFVAATNVDLRQAVKNHTFRADLYYRLAVLTVDLPALRDREGDAMRLARSFIERFNVEFGKEVCELSSEAQTLLSSYPWPGNVRELKNAIERAVLLTQNDVLVLEDFDMLGKSAIEDPTFTLPAAGIDIREIEKSFVEQALTRTGGNRTRAAKLLGMNRDQIRYRIEQFGLEAHKHTSYASQAPRSAHD